MILMVATTAGYYRSLTDVSPATATKDLAATVFAGLLQAEGRHRGRHYLPTERLYELVGAALLIEVSGRRTEPETRSLQN